MKNVGFICPQYDEYNLLCDLGKLQNGDRNIVGMENFGKTETSRAKKRIKTCAILFLDITLQREADF